MRRLTRGKQSASYRLRAEIRGRFSALPTNDWAMYAAGEKACPNFILPPMSNLTRGSKELPEPDSEERDFYLQWFANCFHGRQRNSKARKHKTARDVAET